MRESLAFLSILVCAVAPAAAQQETTEAEQPADDPAQTRTSGADPSGADPDASQEKAPAVRHFPENECDAGPLELRFEVDSPDTAGQVVVHYLAHDGRSGQAVARRSTEGYRARIPQGAVQPPGLRYWVVRKLPDGRLEPVFASAERPHRVRVFHDPQRARTLRQEGYRGGKRSSVIARGEYVDFGSRRISASSGSQRDRYYRLEAGYAYAFLTTLEDIQLTVVRVRGEAGVAGAGLVEEAQPGTDYGRARLSLMPLEFVRLRAAVLLGASQEGFEYGGSGELVLGNPYDLSLSLRAESLTTLGYTTALRMGFHVTPRIPMGASVEISNFPVGQDAGVRLLYDIGYVLTPGTRIVVRGGYQARTSVTGGPALGAALRYGF
ncbi:MAG: hypothetical protein OEZ06_06555 [Myxococcales bacterium]|nr:hypothetical protein [Myxococcales bacterium]